MSEIFKAVLSMSLGGALLALLIIGARAIIGRRPGPFLPVLYGLLMLRLMLPFAVPSPFSAMNLLPVPPANTPAVTVQTVGSPPDPPSFAVSMPDPVAADTFPGNTDTVALPAANTGTAPVAAVMEPVEIAAIVWLTGAALAAAVLIAGNIRFLRQLKRRRAYDAPDFIMLLDECKALLGMRRKLPAVQTQGISAAAVYGVFRPRLLISPESFTSLSPDQQRHVLLHELSHIHRGDTAVCFLAAALSILHWFNPFVWLAFALMRRDIEVFCDDSVIKALGEQERPDYAATLLALAAPPQTPRMVTALFISHRCVKKRILAVIRRKKASMLYSAAALLLTILIAVTGCTAAMAEIPDISEPPEPDAATPSPVVTVQASTSESAETKTPRLIAAVSYGIPEDEMRNDAIIANLDKTIALINGRKLSRNESFSLMHALGSLKADQGWQIAPSPGWQYLSNKQSAVQETAPERIAQAGGGVEILAAALHEAAYIAGMNVRLINGGQELSTGDLMIDNKLDEDIYLGISRTDNMIVVNLSTTGQAMEPLSPEPDPGQTEALIAAFTLDISRYANTALVDNITKAARMLNGVKLEPGRQLSLNELLGPHTAARGWKTAPGITEDATYAAGAGVSMVATALYNAALRADLTIAESRHHSIPADYVDGGLDVTISSSGPDLKISNPHDAAVMFTVSYSNNQLMVAVLGPQLPYILDFYSEKAGMTAEPETIYHYNAATTPDGQPIAPGKSIIYAAPRAGQTFRVYKTTKDLSGNILKTELFSEVSYAAIQGHVYVNGPDPSESTG